MASERPHTPPSSADGEGVRVTGKARPASRAALVGLFVVIALIAVVVAWRIVSRPPAASSDDARVSGVDAVVDQPVSETSQRSAPHPSSSMVAESTAAPASHPSDPSNYVQPGDPEPTGAEVIGAMHDLNIHTGIGAFNPPGTSPPLEGLAVPEDFVLPTGYVRHYQSTDAGEPIEPILMYSPDITLRDASGKPIAMPADRVVPIDQAPPGLPVRWVSIPRP